MAGRWAQLAVDAHIAHAIDYSRPVKPFIETAIFNRLELRRKLELLGLYPTIEDGEAAYISNSWVENVLKAQLFSWKVQKNAAPGETNIYDRINELNRIRATNAH